MMIDSQPLHTSDGRDPGSGGISPVTLLVALGRGWPLVLATAFVATLAGIGFALLRAPVYSAQTLLFLAQGQNDPRAQLSAQFTGAMGAGGSNTKLVTTILSSRSLRDSVARRAGRVGEVNVQPNPDGAIRVTVSDRDPEMAARIANAYPAVLNLLVARIGAQTNRQKESLLERQIVEVRTRLEASEDRLVRYQTGRNATDVEEQSRATLSAAVQLQQRVAEKEVELATLRRTATPDNPRLRAAAAELGTLRQQLRSLSSGGGMGRILVPLEEGPALKVGAARLVREYSRNEQIYIALTAALAQAQIDLNGSLPVVTVVDPANLPTTPDGAGVLKLALVAGVLGLVAGGLIAIGLDIVRQMRRNPERDPFLAVWQGIHENRVARASSRS